MIPKTSDNTLNPEYYCIDYRTVNLSVNFGKHLTSKLIKIICKSLQKAAG